MSSGRSITKGTKSASVAAFLDEAGAVAPVEQTHNQSRLIFAIDATMSRQPTWDLACSLQADMFSAVKSDKAANALLVQLVYFRGLAECRASRWYRDPEALGTTMSRLQCRGGRTQIGKVLAHARKQTEAHRVPVVVYIGDAIEEDPDELATKAGELALHGTKLFMFQEGHDPHACAVMKDLARVTHGVWHSFDRNAPRTLSDLLKAAAVYVAKGEAGLKALNSRAAASLLSDMRRS